jgi:hypothetical protein
MGRPAPCSHRGTLEPVPPLPLPWSVVVCCDGDGGVWRVCVRGWGRGRHGDADIPRVAVAGAASAVVATDDLDLGAFAVATARRDLLPPIALERLGINNELSGACVRGLCVCMCFREVCVACPLARQPRLCLHVNVCVCVCRAASATGCHATRDSVVSMPLMPPCFGGLCVVFLLVACSIVVCVCVFVCVCVRARARTARVVYGARGACVMPGCARSPEVRGPGEGAAGGVPRVRAH